YRVNSAEQFGCWLSPRAIEAVNGQLGLLVGAVLDLFVERAPDAVLGTEQCDECYAFGFPQKVNRRPALAIAARMIGHESDPLSPKSLKVFRDADIDTCSTGSRQLTFGIRRLVLFPVPNRGRHNSRHLTAQLRDISFTVGMNTVAQENNCG